MPVPKFTAETSLYKSIRLYCGYSGRTGLDTTSSVVAAAISCEVACGVADVACLGACSLAGPFAPLCWAGCQAATVACLLNCQDGDGGSGGGGGGTGGPHPIGCKFGEKCCERDRDGNCLVCAPHNGECP
jgi:hypothetical protein